MEMRLPKKYNKEVKPTLPHALKHILFILPPQSKFTSWYFSEDFSCQLSNLLQMLNSEAGSHLNVFMELTVHCAGQIFHWDFHAQAPGVSYALI